MFCLSLHYNGESSYLFVNGRNLSNNRTLTDKKCQFSFSILFRKHIWKIWYYWVSEVTVKGNVYDFNKVK